MVVPGLICSRRAPSLQHAGSLVVACELLVVLMVSLVAVCMWDLVPWPGIEPRPPVLRTQSLNHCSTREVSTNLILNVPGYFLLTISELYCRILHVIYFLKIPLFRLIWKFSISDYSFSCYKSMLNSTKKSILQRI